MGYDSKFIVDNLGTIFFVLIATVLTNLIYSIVKATCYKRGFFKDTIEYLTIMLFYGAYIRFFLEGYLELAISSIKNLAEVNIGDSKSFTVHESVSNALAVIMVILISGFPLLMAYVLFLKHDQVVKEDKLYVRVLFGHNKALKKKDPTEYMPVTTQFGAFFEGLKLENLGTLTYYLFFMVRRMILAIILVCYQEYPGNQIQMILLLNLAMTIIQGKFEPYSCKYKHKLEMTNEYCNTLLIYHYVTLTDFGPDRLTQYEIGWSAIAL